MLIFIYGENLYLSREKLNKIRDKFVQEVDPQGFNLSIVDGAKTSIEELNRNFGAVSFLSNKRMIIIKNLITHNKKIEKQVVDLLKQKRIIDNSNLKDNNIIVFYEESGKKVLEKEGKNLFKILTKIKYSQEMKPLSNIELYKWVKNKFNQLGSNIDNQALKLFISNAGIDLWQIENEIKKIVHYKKGTLMQIINNNNKEEIKITQTDIERVATINFDKNIFSLVDALANKNKFLSIKLINNQLNEGANMIYLFSMIIRQFRILLQVKEMITKNYSQREIIARLKLHPFVVKKAIAQSKFYLISDLKKILEKFLKVDLEMKTSKISPQLLFDLLIAEM